MAGSWDDDIDDDIYLSGEDTTLPKPSEVAAQAGDDDDYLEDIEVEIPSAPAKRKLGDDDEEQEDSAIKRQRVSLKPFDMSRVPPGILQRIFAHLSPKDLGRYLTVSRSVQEVLTAPASVLSNNGGIAVPLDGNDVWKLSRQEHAPELPAPLEGVSEQRMITLLCNTFCEHCKSRPTAVNPRPNFWSSGPGPDGLRVIWHFGVRLCGKCFEELTAKDVEVIVTPDKILLPGLPFVFRSTDKHYIPPSLQKANRGAIPSHVQLSKVYYRPSLNERRVEVSKLEVSAPHLVDTWLKQELPVTVQRKSDDAIRWITWEASLPVGKSTIHYALDILNPSTIQGNTITVGETIANLTHHHTLPARVQMPDHTSHHPLYANGGLANADINQLGNAGFPAYFSGLQQPYANGQHDNRGQHAHHDTSSQHLQHSDQQSILPSIESVTSNHASPAPERDRNKFAGEIKALQAARKAEIERRCVEDLQPPLYPNVLQHMPAFKAAIFIARDLTEHDWQTLKPRLMEQRLQAEETERSKLQTLNSSQYVDHITQRVNRRAAPGELTSGDPQREHAQRPVRKILLQIAQQVINEKWGGAEKLLKQDVYNFAADIILTTLKEFREQTSVDDFDMGHAITLETVKHLFDNRIKPHTDKLVRDLFLCSECEESAKYYTFDGMMQHFGAKHEPEFGKGNVIVAWHTAQWPDVPPFKERPTLSRRVPPIYAEEAAAALKRKSMDVSTPPAASLEVITPSFLASLKTVLPPPPVATPPSSWPNMDNSGPSTESRPSPALRDEDFTKSTQTPPKPYAPRKKATHEQPKHPGHMSENPYLKALPAPPTDASTAAEREEVAKIATEMMKHASGVTDLPDSVRLQTIIVNTAQQYGEKFGTQLSVQAFQESLKHPRMKILRKYGGIRCHICVSTRADYIDASTTYMLFALLQHFKGEHLNRVENDKLPNWLTDMIELPSIEEMREIPFLQGITDEKLCHIVFALPKAVWSDGMPSAQPRAKHELQSTSFDLHSHELSLVVGPNRAHFPKHLDSDLEEGEVSMPEAGEAEYDPRRPSLIKDPMVPSPLRHSGAEMPRLDRKTRKSGRPYDPHRKRGKQFDYDGMEIPDVIRRPYDPSGKQDVESIPDSPPSPQRRDFSGGAGGARRQLSPPRYFDQNGRPVDLQFMEPPPPPPPEHQDPPLPPPPVVHRTQQHYGAAASLPLVAAGSYGAAPAYEINPPPPVPLDRLQRLVAPGSAYYQQQQQHGGYAQPSPYGQAAAYAAPPPPPPATGYGQPVYGQAAYGHAAYPQHQAVYDQQQAYGQQQYPAYAAAGAGYAASPQPYHAQQGYGGYEYGVSAQQVQYQQGGRGGGGGGERYVWDSDGA